MISGARIHFTDSGTATAMSVVQPLVCRRHAPQDASLSLVQGARHSIQCGGEFRASWGDEDGGGVRRSRYSAVVSSESLSRYGVIDRPFLFGPYLGRARLYGGHRLAQQEYELHNVDGTTSWCNDTVMVMPVPVRHCYPRHRSGST